MLCLVLTAGPAAAAPFTLTGTNYTQNFDSVGTALPAGWDVRTGANASGLGTAAAFTTADTPAASTAGRFSNYQSVTTGATSADRAIGVRQTGSFGDPGAAFNFNFDSGGFEIGSINFDALLISAQPRDTTWSLQIGSGAAPTSWTTLGTWASGSLGAAGAAPQAFTLDAAQKAIVSNQSSAWFRMVALTSSAGSGTRDTSGLDNFTMSYTPLAADATLTWFGDGATAGGGGTWSASGVNWNDGTTTGTWDSAKTAIFSGVGGAVAVDGTITVSKGMTFSGSGYELAGGALVLTGAAGTNLVSVAATQTALIGSAIGGSGGITKIGDGTLRLAGDNALLSGTVGINAGTLEVAAVSNLGGATAIQLGGTLRTVGSIDLGSRSLAGAGTLDLPAGSTLATSGAVNLETLAIPNAATLSFTGFDTRLGSITTTHASGTTVIAGNVNLGDPSRTFTVGSGGTLEMTGVLTNNLAAVPGTLSKLGGGTLVLGADNSGSLFRVSVGSQGATPVDGGTVVIGSGGALGYNQTYFNYGTIHATDPVSLDYGLSIGGREATRSRLTGADMTVSGSITLFAAGGATGAITLQVDNDTTFAGRTVISATTAANAVTVRGSGILRVTGEAQTAAGTINLADTVRLSVQANPFDAFVGDIAGTVNVGGSATLQGDGRVGTINVNSGGTLSPGMSPGTLRAGTVTWNAGGNYNVQVADAAGSAGSGWDLLDVSGTLTVASTSADPFKLNLWSLASTSPDVNGDAANFNNQSGYSWTVARAAGGLVGFSADKFAIDASAVNGTGGFTNDLAGGAFSVAAVVNDVNVVFTPFIAGSSLTWYGNGATAGGSGSWTSLGSTWSPDAGATIGTWDPARTAVFGASGGTVVVQPAGITASRGLQFNADGYAIEGGGVTLAGATQADNAITVASAATTTIRSAVAGSAGMTKAGAGTLVLTGSNTLSGGVAVTAGTLQVGDGTMAGSLSGNISIETGATIAFDNDTAAGFSGGLSGSGGATKQGSGDLRLSGASSHSGGVRVEGGSVTAANGSAFGTGIVTAVDGGVLTEAGATVSNAITVGVATAAPTPTLIAGWDFQTTTTGGTAVLAAPNTPKQFAANFGAGSLHLDGSNGSSNWLLTTSSTNTQLDGFAGTTANAGTGFSTVTTSPSALALVNGSGDVVGGSANGQHAVFTFDMTGYEYLDVSYATRFSSSNAFTSQAWSFSTDGTNWEPLETIADLTTSFVTRRLSPFNGLANSGTARLRLTVDGATSSTGNNRLDNVQIVGTPQFTPAGTVTLGTPSTSGVATFGGNVTLHQDVNLSAAAGGTAVFSGSLSDPTVISGVRKLGAGTVILGGSNSYRGGTTVSAGTLLVNASTATSGFTVENGATLGGSGTVGAVTTTAGSTLSPGAGVGTLSAAGTVLAGGANIDWQLVNAGGTTPGTDWDLLGVTGGLAINATAASPLAINLWTVSDAAGTSGQASGFDPVRQNRWTFATATTGITGFDPAAFTVNASATNGAGGFANNTLGGTFSVALSTLGTGLDIIFTPNAAFSSLVWYGDDETPGGKGVWTDLNVNWFNQGTSALTTWDAAKTAVFDTTGSEVTIGPGGIAASNGLRFSANNYVVEGGTLTLSGGSTLANTVTVDAGVSTTFSSAVAGSAGMTKSGSGTLVLAGANTLAGGVTVAGGTLEVGTGGTAGSLATDVIVGSGATFAIHRSDETTFTGGITGSGSLAKRGAGTLVLTGSNSFSGGTTVSEGTVVVGDGLNGGSILATGDLDLADGAVLAFDRADAVGFSGAVAGAGTLVQRGSGTLTFSRSGTGNAYGNAFTLRVEDGTVDLNRADVTLEGILGPGNTVELAGGTLQLSSNGGEETKFQGAAIDVQQSSMIAIQRTGTTSNNHSTSGFAAPITVGNRSTLTFDYRGAIGTSGSTVYKGTTNYTSGVTLASDATFAVTNSAGGTAEVIFSGDVADGGGGFGITKTGDQRLTLTGSANTYSGPTHVAAGTLALGTNALIANSPSVTIAAGATLDVTAKTAGYAAAAGQTLGGAGTVAGSVILGSAATLAPGASPGTLSVTQGVTWASGGNYNWQVLDAAGTAGSPGGWDLLNVGGVLTIGANPADRFVLNLWSLAGSDTSGSAINFDATQQATWKIASAAGGISGFASDAFTINTAAANGTDGFANPLAGGSFAVAVSGNDLNLVFTPAGSGPGPVRDWFGDGEFPGRGGGWTNSDNRWSNGSGAGPWSPSFRGRFGGEGGVVEIQGGGVTASAGLEFTGDGYEITGQSLTLGGTTAADNDISVADTAIATIAAPVAASAGVRKSGAGSLIVGGTVTAGGTVEVAAGVLAVGVGGTAGAVEGNVSVASGATLAFDRSDDTTYAGNLSGEGDVQQLGTGTLRLSGSGSHTGNTVVRSGKLRIESPHAVASSPVTVEGAAAVEIAPGVVMKAPIVTVEYTGTLSAPALAVNAATGIANLLIDGGTVAGSPAVTVGTGGTMSLADDIRQTASLASLAVDEAAGGKIDIGKGRINVAAGGITAADLRADLLAARNAGSWNGASGIGSSEASNALRRAVGYRVQGSGAIVAWAAFGDMNLDGFVNSSDLNLLIAGNKYGTAATDGVWAQGDFNYDGRVNSSDLNLLLAAGLYGQASYLPATTRPLAFGDGDMLTGLQADGGMVGPVAAVPEPSAGGLLLLAGCLLAAYNVRRGRGRSA